MTDTTTPRRPVGRPRIGPEIKLRLGPHDLASVEEIAHAEDRDRSLVLGTLVREALAARHAAATRPLLDTLMRTLRIDNPRLAAVRALSLPDIRDTEDLFAAALAQLAAEDDNGRVRNFHETPTTGDEAAWICAYLAAEKAAYNWVLERTGVHVVDQEDPAIFEAARRVALRGSVGAVRAAAKARPAAWQRDLLALPEPVEPTRRVHEWVAALYPAAYAALEPIGNRDAQDH